MKIKLLVIDGIAGIQHLELNFNQSINVICGINGIGKTTILDVIADAFNAGVTSKLKRNAQCSVGKYKIEIELEAENGKTSDSKEVLIDVFQPDTSFYHGTWQNYAKKVLSFGIDRNIHYIKLSAVISDPKRGSYDNGKMAVEGISADDIKSWFVQRFLFYDKQGSLNEKQKANFEFSKTIFGILDNTVTFKTVAAGSLDIILSTDRGEIYFEYLSAGYKSCIYIILGMIKEIEYRFAEIPIEAKEFDGVVLIDESELHLHSSWQGELIRTLKTIFPQTQFIVTTHSPNVLQCLEKDEIIALGKDERGNTIVKKLQLGKFGLRGWTLEEIMKDVMEMPAVTSQLYQETLKRFDKAMNQEEQNLIIEQYNLLKEMLHPENPLRKLLSIQVAEWEA
ncbi:MAG: AAA family ATPase [Lachnospiraceae bacterium]|nr:AAA family ATPase [Lachnospiraceae bacterium]